MLAGKRLQRKVAPLAAKFAAAGHPIRLSILYMLREEPTDAGDIVERINLPAALVSHHLRILAQTGLVTKTTYGKAVTYYINPKIVSLLSESD